MKGRLFGKKKGVMYLLSYVKECQRSLQLLKNKSWLELGHYFWHLLTPVKIYHYFQRVATFGGSLLWELYGMYNIDRCQ